MGSGRLRILHAIHDFLPRHRAGSQIYAANLCAALAARGHHPVVLCADFDPQRTHGELSWRSHEGVPVIEIANNWRCSSFEETYRSPVLDRLITDVIGIVQPHVLHVHNLLNLSIDLPRIARSRGIPVVATLHDYTLVCPSGGQRIHRAERHICHTIDPARCARCFRDTPFHTQLMAGRIMHGRRGRALGKTALAVRRIAPRLALAVGAALKRAPGPVIEPRSMERRLVAVKSGFHFFDLAVAPSRHLAGEYARLGFPAEKLHVSDYGFPPSQRSLGTIQPRASDHLRIGFVGTLTWHKGIDLLIDSIRLVPLDRIEVSIFGDPNVDPDYSRDLMSRAAGLPVHFKGGFNRYDLHAVFSRIDLLVVPSRWLENSPLVIHEAFLAGVPVAAARIGGIPELVDHGRNGLLFEPDSVGALADAIRTVLDHPECLLRFRAALPAVKRIDDDAAEWESRYQVVLGRGDAVAVSAH